MSKSLSPEAVEALRRLNDVGVGQSMPKFAQSVTAELLANGLAAEASGGGSRDHLQRPAVPFRRLRLIVG